MIIKKYIVPIFFAALVYSVISCKKETSEINLIPAFKGDTTTLLGLAQADEGVNAAHHVFMNFRRGVKSRALRLSWDFGVYAGAENRLILNYSMGATAVALNKTVLAQVSAEDTVGLATANTLILGARPGIVNIADPVAGSFANYLGGTVIGDITDDMAAAKVFIVNRGVAGGVGIRRWYKMKVYMVDRRYKVDFALITDTARFSSLTISKDDSFNFKYGSFTVNEVAFEPARLNWDMQWGWSTYRNAAGTAVAVPDFVQINAGGGVRAAQVIFSGTNATTGKRYEDYVFEDQLGLTYLEDRDVIGVNWRNATPESGPLTVYRDRFYLIKDAEGNVYKLRFLSFTPNDGGQRGRPRIEYRLLEPAAN